MAHLFRSIQNAKTRTQIAVEIAEDTIEDYKRERESLSADDPESEHTKRLLLTLAALMKGPHKAAVRPVVERAFPVLAAPQGEA